VEEKYACRAIPDVEFHEVVRQRIIGNGMFREQPFPIKDIPIFEEVKEPILVALRPRLE